MKLLKYENGKLHNQLIFTLPAIQEVCNRTCKGCYAIKFQRLYPSVLPYRNRMLAASKQKDFTSQVISEIKACKKKVVAIRIHESGEFYSQEYINKWYTIASSFPSMPFYTFTKRLADFDFSKLSSLPNFVLINSLQHGSLNYGKLSTLDKSKFICPYGTSIRCGIECNYCWTKKAQQQCPQFVKH